MIALQQPGDGPPSVAEVLFSEESPVLLMHDHIHNDGMLSDAIVAALFAVLAGYQARAAALGATRAAAIATAVFRTARNGGTVLQRIRDELGLPVQVRARSPAPGPPRCLAGLSYEAPVPAPASFNQPSW